MRTRASSGPSVGSAFVAAGFGCAFWLALIAVNVTVGAFALQYVVSYWTLYALHVAKHIPFLPGS